MSLWHVTCILVIIEVIYICTNMVQLQCHSTYLPDNLSKITSYYLILIKINFYADDRRS